MSFVDNALATVAVAVSAVAAAAAAAAATCCRRLWRHRIVGRWTLRMRRTICNLQLIERVRRRSLLSTLTLLNPPPSG